MEEIRCKFCNRKLKTFKSRIQRAGKICIIKEIERVSKQQLTFDRFQKGDKK